jgi:hypothetical protein
VGAPKLRLEKVFDDSNFPVRIDPLLAPASDLTIIRGKYEDAEGRVTVPLAVIVTIAPVNDVHLDDGSSDPCVVGPGFLDGFF